MTSNAFQNIMNEILTTCLGFASDNFLVYAVAIGGQILHQFKKWGRDSNGEIGFIKFITAHPWNTFFAVAGSLVAISIAINSGAITPGESGSILAAATTGWSADSLLNKSPAVGDYGYKNQPTAYSDSNLDYDIGTPSVNDKPLVEYDPRIWYD